ncbi:hypothetical protein QBC35DRAFT_487863 [Podospora australis]|uniref:Uncharacterized protein n=1 Tax=Podospora australis TaxID=1536484 RepID=A0AAN6X4M3_9PEZI|nr:hypothetical protein QBC35DRAFT_487863 [Podospora australis]
MKVHHRRLRCNVPHCSVIIYNIEIDTHIAQSHGPYECAFGQCQNAGASSFTEDGLIRHLKHNHNMSPGALTNTIANMRMDGTTTAKSEHFPNNGRVRRWEDCTKCAPQQGGLNA